MALPGQECDQEGVHIVSEGGGELEQQQVGLPHAGAVLLAGVQEGLALGLRPVPPPHPDVDLGHHGRHLEENTKYRKLQQNKKKSRNTENTKC